MPAALVARVLAQQGGRDKAVAILQGWGRDKSGMGSLGARLLLQHLPPALYTPWLSPQNHLQGWEPLGRTPVPSPLCHHQGHHLLPPLGDGVWGHGTGHRA